MTFGFMVRTWGDDKWEVSLPHSCDQWVITESPHSEAITELERFLVEGAEALAALRSRETFDNR